MSVCMNYSAKCAPNAGRFLASRRGMLNSPRMKNTTWAKRWHSSEVPNSIGGRVKASAERGRGWATIHVLGLVVSTSIVAYVLAISRSPTSKGYSNPPKFVEPKYASIRDMKTVSSNIGKPVVTNNSIS